MVRGPDREVTRKAVKEVMVERGSSSEPWTSSELAEILGCSSDTVYHRLRELETLDEIRTKKVGARARIWWIPNTDARVTVDDNYYPEEQDIMASRDDKAEPWTTSEIADRHPHKDRDQIYHVLRYLDGRGAITSKSVGSRARVWWIPPEDENEAEAPPSD